MGTSVLKMSENQAIAETSDKPWCLIPAKKKSKRLPHKNKLEINGKPMVQHAIDVAVESELFDKVFVNSDDEDILELAYRYMKGSIASTENVTHVLPIKRPRLLCQSQVQIRDLVRFHIYQFKRGNILCVLVPCNPFRTVEDLKAGWDILWKKKANYVLSIKRQTPPPQWAMRKRGKYLEPFLGHGYLRTSQELEPLYVHDGVFVWARVEPFLKEADMDFHGSKCAYYETPRISVDIDTPEDFEYARWILEKNP